MKFTQEIKDKWLAALRSGEYKQGQRFLYDAKDNTFCCVGVLGIVCDTPKEELLRKEMIYLPNTKDTNDVCLLTDQIPLLIESRGDEYILKTLASMNDHGKDFNQIADYIEKNIPAGL